MIAVIALILAIVAIHPSFSEGGVAIRSVVTNSSASLAGISPPKAGTSPMTKERIISINGKIIKDIRDYNNVISSLKPGDIVKIRTNKATYSLIIKPKYNITVLPEMVNITKTIKKNITINGTIKTIKENITIQVNKTIKKLIGAEDLGLKVFPAPTSNIRLGLDLQGGTRVILEPEKKVSKDDMDLIINNLKQRLNVFGLSDIIVREVKDLSGKQYILIEVPGTTEEEVRELVAKQGKFEAKIGNITVFSGGNDITHVCRSADCAGIDPRVGCGTTGENQWACRFRFSISLSPEAAEREAEATKDLDIVVDENGGRERYLSKKLDLYLDNQKVDSLNIGEELKGKPIRDVAISGSGVGRTKQEAMYNALQNMKRLQTILITGSLPVKLNIVKVDTISPVLGQKFLKNAVILAIVAIIGVVTVVYLRYRRYEIVIPMALTLLNEIILLLGMAALIGWNLDIAAIAGIIVAVGTGVDDQIVIADETLSKKAASTFRSWKEKIKSAFFIIMASYFTTVVAMVPLLFAGAGLLKGFALTTILGVSIGVFITRPAFAAAVEILAKDKR